MQARKKLRTGSLVLGFSLWVLLSLGCGGVQIPPASIAGAYYTVYWSPDGSQVVFSRHAQGTFVVDVGGTSLHSIPLDTPIGEAWQPGSASAALSPDGSRVAYVEVFNDGFLGGYNAEIMSARVDGTDARRLTFRKAEFDDTKPRWSPDGRRIAFLMSHVSGRSDYIIALMDADGSNFQYLLELPDGQSVHSTLEWSPDGRWIGFLCDCPSPGSSDRRVLFTVRSDGTEVLDLGEAASPPAWSPDGTRIAFFQDSEGGMEMITASADGTDRQQVLALARAGERSSMNLLWSPDGAALLYFDRWQNEPAMGAIVSIEDGSILADFAGVVAAWSPDGSRIAVQTRICERGYLSDCNPDFLQDVLYTIARDGTDRQVLVRGSATEMVPGADWYDVSADIAACAELHAGNPGLVEDCRTLLTIRNALAGDSFLNWSAEVPIGEWEGVSVAGEPLRVVELAFSSVRRADDHKLKGVIPPELGNLSELRALDLGIKKLTGSIPPELGNLSKLQWLILQHNLLSGSIPPELGNLSNLRWLSIQGNNLSGCVPRALSETVTQFHSDGLEYCE